MIGLAGDRARAFPVWYHLVFLASLVPLALLGARARR